MLVGVTPTDQHGPNPLPGFTALTAPGATPTKHRVPNPAVWSCCARWVMPTSLCRHVASCGIVPTADKRMWC